MLVLCQCSVIVTTGIVPSVKYDIMYCMYMLTVSCSTQNVNDKVCGTCVLIGDCSVEVVNGSTCFDC